MRRPSPIAGFVIAALMLDAAGAAAQTPPARDGLAASKARIASGSPTYIRRERPDCADFSRKPDATWTANRAVAFPAPEGLLKVDQGSIYRIGQVYGGYDLAAMLEHDCPKG